MRKIRLILLLTVLASLAAGAALRQIYPEKKVDEALYLKEAVPDVEFYAKAGNHYPSKEGAVAFNTFDLRAGIRGYAGPIKVLVALAPDGKIAGIKILEHRETPNFVHRMESPKFLGQFLGKDITDPFEVDRDIDGISRATVSVRAMADSVREAGRDVASGVMGLDVALEAAGKKGQSDLRWVFYAAFFVFAFSVYLLSRGPKKLSRLRDAMLFLSVPVVGFYLSSPFSILHVFNAASFRPSADMLWYALLLSVGLSMVFAGRFYCGWICPFGALSELIGRLPVRKWAIPAETDERWRKIKYFLLGLSAAAVFVSGKSRFGNYEAYVALFSFHGSPFMWALVAVSLAANLRVRRFWCRFLCPVAAFMGVFSRADSGYVSRPGCPMSNRPSPHISECIRCNSCYGEKR